MHLRTIFALYVVIFGLTGWCHYQNCPLRSTSTSEVEISQLRVKIRRNCNKIDDLSLVSWCEKHLRNQNFISCTLLKVIGTWRGWFAENPLQNKNFVFNQFMPLTLQLFRVWKYISGWNCWDTMQKSVNITLTQILDGYVHPRPPSSINLHPAPSTSIQLILTSNQLHLAYFSLRSALYNTLNNIWTKILHVIGQFPQI